jgi:ABC-type amino acid transport substrate-binding protein
MRLTLLLSLALLTAAAVARADDHKLVVGTRAIAPFVLKSADGKWSGISIDLWKRVAEEQKLDYEIREYELGDLLEPDKAGIDVVVSVNITARNEAFMDVTHPFFSTGLAIATRSQPKSGFGTIAGKMLSANFLKGIGVLALLLLIMGILVWRVERKNKPEEYGGSVGKAIAYGVFWAFESLFNKAAPLTKTRAGRTLVILWAVTGMLLISGVTAKLASELTVSQLSSTVAGPNDLPKVKVGTTSPSLSASYLESRSINYLQYNDVPAALDALERGEIAAVVYEAPILQYQVTKNHPGKLLVLPGTFQNHGYGFGLKSGSPLRERVNQNILKIVEGDEWKRSLSRYLGNTE